LLEDNPFYRESPEMGPVQPELGPLSGGGYEDAEPDAAPSGRASGLPPDAATQGPAGVSTYTSVPDIAGASREDASGMLAASDKLNLWSVAAVIAVVMMLRQSGAFENALARISGFLRRFALLALAMLFAAAFSIFTLPYAFKTGVSGDINALAMLEFGVVIFLNATSVVCLAAVFLRAKGLIRGEAAAFPGIKFLQLSLWTFLLCALLFLFFTESNIAFMALYCFAFLNAAAMFAKLGAAELSSLEKWIPAAIGLQLALVGSLVGVYAVLMAGAVLAGAPLSSPDDRKRFVRILGKMV
jgi:hypothetical protein